MKQGILKCCNRKYLRQIFNVLQFRVISNPWRHDPRLHRLNKYLETLLAHYRKTEAADNVTAAGSSRGGADIARAPDTGGAGGSTRTVQAVGGAGSSRAGQAVGGVGSSRASLAVGGAGSSRSSLAVGGADSSRAGLVVVGARRSIAGETRGTAGNNYYLYENWTIPRGASSLS